MSSPIRLGMVGGGLGSFIGPVHRAAAALDGSFTLVSGCLSSEAQRSLASAAAIGLDPARSYATWRQMVERERSLPEGVRIQAVTIVTPNDAHFEIARACLEAGFHVIVDKPMTRTADEADGLADAAGRSGRVLCVTYTYSGYPMVRQARAMAQAGALGAIRRVQVDYSQGWLGSAIERTGQKQATWRLDPARAGPGGAIGDIGSHAFHLATFVTGLTPRRLCADLASFIPGRALDDDASVLLRFEGGARGTLTASQVCTGSGNDLRLRVWGERGGLEWRHEEPNSLIFRPGDAPEQVFRAAGPSLHLLAAGASRLPAGHPEGYIEAFANIYRDAAAAMRGEPAPCLPTVRDGAMGMRFIARAIESARAGGAWVDA